MEMLALILIVIGLAALIWFTLLFVGACKALTQISEDMRKLVKANEAVRQ